MPLYEIKNLCKERQGYALTVPEFALSAGERVVVTGPSGSGKSTLLDMLGLVLRPDGVESFRFASGPGPGCDVAEAWRHGRLEELAAARRQMGYVLQTGALLPFLRVRDNMLVPRRLLGLADGDAAERLAERLGIGQLLTKFPAQLSVGERQRVAIARALAAEPPLVLADEPTAALDPAHAKGVLDLFMELAEENGTALVLVTHAPEQAAGRGFRRLRVTQETRVREERGEISEAVLTP